MSMLMTTVMLITASFTMTTSVRAAQPSAGQTQPAGVSPAASQPAAVQSAPAQPQPAQPALPQAVPGRPPVQNTPGNNPTAATTASSASRDDNLQTTISESYGAHAMGIDKLKLFARA